MFARHGRVGPALTAAAAALLTMPIAAPAQIAGENVNMVTGTRWPGGDPFLQRQNEPSVAISSANPEHLLAGANDYRTVDLPDPGSPDDTGDAWLGLFKSLDGGQTWQSVLVPGYPQDQSPEGLASPLRGLRAAADPVVRAGTDGMLYYSGIAFNRGSNVGKVFVARFVDLNNKENGDATLARDPMKYLETTTIDVGTSGQFLDKPWIATDVPRAGAATCSLPVTPARTFPAGNVYIAYAMFTGSQGSSSKVMFRRSTDCGQTWGATQKLSESNSVNQGTAVAVDPVSGAVYVAWRRFATSSQPDAILIAKSTDFGQTFTKGLEVASGFLPFDQDTTATSFRAEALPALAVSVAPTGSRSWVHLAWAQRAAPGADARIVMTTSADGLAWPAPAPVDDQAIADDDGNAQGRGHQLMPALAFSQGRLMLLFYDTRLDHLRSYYLPHAPFVPDPVTGSFYRETWGPVGERASGGDQVFTPTIDDAGLTQVRHTLDVRVGQADPGPSPAFTGSGKRTTRVSQFRFGTRGDETPNLEAPGFQGPIAVTDASSVLRLQQLQVNPPNLPMFKQGTLPFMGDYIDIAGPAFVKTASGWAFNSAPARAPVHYAVWTSNQDVRPPPADPITGVVDWTRYTPIGAGSTSLYDGVSAPPLCLTGYEGTRNQNIYGARITDGLRVTSPQNAKPLGAATRTFVVAAQNTTAAKVPVRFSLELPSPLPAGLVASFRNDGVSLQSFDVEIPPRSSVFRTLFVRSPNAPAATMVTHVDEIDGTSGCSLAAQACPLKAGGLSGAVTLNPPGSSPSLVAPDGATDPATGEVYAPSIAIANITAANITAANITASGVTNANITAANITAANITAANVINADLANITAANITAANLTAANITAANITAANITAANITAASVADANYLVTNAGNTTHSYHVAIAGAVPPGTPLQLIVSKPSTTPVGIGCVLEAEPRNVIVTSIDDVSAALLPLSGSLGDPNIPDSRITNATLSLAPGETAQITLRGVFGVGAMQLLATQAAPVVVPHAGGSFAAALLVASDGATLPAPRVGVPYSASLQAIGGTAPYSWALVAGSLPPGLALASDGRFSGTPTLAGASTFAVQVTDSAASPAKAQRAVTLTVGRGATATSLATSTDAAVFGQAVTFTASVASLGTGAPAPTGIVTFRDGAAVLGTAGLAAGGTATFTTTSLAVGDHSLAAEYGGDANYTGSGGAHAVVVSTEPTALLLESSLQPSTFGQQVSFTATVAPSGPGTPAGAVTFLDGSAVLGTAPLAAGRASIATASLDAGAHGISARYPGDGAFEGSIAAIVQVVGKAPTSTALASSPNPSAYGQPVALTASVSSAAGTPTGSVTFRDGASSLGTVALGGGAASLSSASLAVGSHVITAAYGGDPNHEASTSSPLVQAVGYVFTGFLSPLATAGTLASPSLSGAQNYGSAVPVKWQLRSAGGAFVTQLGSARQLQAIPTPACAGPPPAGATPILLYSPTSGATGGSTFRYDAAGNQFVFNWDTTKTPGKGCYAVVLQLDDGSPAKATILKLK
jgi:Bacterial Ig-like domain (group 3)